GIVHEARVVALDLPREADAEQAIDHQPPPRPFGEVAGLLGEANAEELAAQPLGDNARVAAVVARAGEHQNVLPAVGSEPRGELRGRGARALHERRSSSGLALDAADVVR